MNHAQWYSWLKDGNTHRVKLNTLEGIDVECVAEINPAFSIVLLDGTEIECVRVRSFLKENA